MIGIGCRPAGWAAIGTVLLAATIACSSSTPRPAPAAPAVTPVGHHLVITAGRASWRLKAPASRLIALPSAGGALLAGGLDQSDTSSNDVYQLTLATGGIRLLGSVPRPFHDAAGAMIGGRVVIFGGGATTTTDTVQRFAGGRASHGRVIGHLPQPRSDLSAVTIAARTYLLGGYTGLRALSDVLETSDGSTFSTVATLPVTVRYAAVATVGRTIWVFGGQHGSHPVRAIQRIDTTTGRASVVGRLPAARSDASAMVIAGRVLIAGGRSASGRTVGSVEEFDPVRHTVRVVAHLRAPVADAASLVVGRTAYLIGGEDNAPVATVQTLTARNVPDHTATPASSSTVSGGAQGTG
jgi:hypothetical protein